MAFAVEYQSWQPLEPSDFSQMRAGKCGEHYVACNIVQHDWFVGGPVMVWGGIPMEGRTAFHSSVCRIKSLAPLGPGFLLVQPHVARVRRQFLEDERFDTSH